MAEKKNELFELIVPSWFRKMNSMPDDPPQSKAYGYETSNARCFVMVYPIPTEKWLPKGNVL